MKYKKYRFLFLVLSVLITFNLIVSCGDNSDNNTPQQNNQQNANSEDFIEEEDIVPEETYIYPELDGEGADFKIFNPTNTWFYYTDLVHEEMTGDILDDAIYTRNRTVEDKFNITIREINMSGNDMWGFNTEVRKVIMSGIDEYDAIFCPASFNGTVGAMLADGLFYDLREITTINLDEEWWNQTMLREAAIGTKDKIFYAGSGINLMTVQAVACVYFNQDMIVNLGLDMPYSKVREGKWTYDVFHEYVRSGANLNGAGDFTWEQNGPAIYGLASYENSSTALLAGAGESFVKADNNGNPVLAIDGQRFVSALTKISEILNLQNGNYLWANESDNVLHYEPIFRNGRALFSIGELKAANVFREMETTFGILPIPKYDENQPAYYSHLINQAPVLVIPVTNPRTEFTGAVLDALAYISNKDIIPVLFDVSVSQKQLRNEDSIEMLQLIKNSGSFEISIAYGWTNTFYDAVRTRIGQGIDMNIVSDIERYRDNINNNIQKTLDLFE